jgi:hypothetical protein
VRGRIFSAHRLRGVLALVGFGAFACSGDESAESVTPDATASGTVLAESDAKPQPSVESGPALDRDHRDSTDASDAGTTSSDAPFKGDTAVDHVAVSCKLDGGCTPGTWVNVTPASVNLTDPLSCGNFGTETVQVDPQHAEQGYAQFNCQGIWKTTDYGQTWNGPVNTGVNGAMAGDCAGGIAIPPKDLTSPPTIYQACIRGAATGFSRSTNGGVDFAHFTVDVAGSNNQFYPPAIDPYDPKHLLMAGHGVAVLAQTVDGGSTWSAVQLAAGMMGGATGGINFIDTGNAATTRNTWLWLSQATGGGVGTWRTSTGAANGDWTRVQTNEHPAGISSIYQPDSRGTVYMVGLYSKDGWGVFRSADYGQTWTHFGSTTLQERVVFGTPKQVYAMMGNEVGGTGSDPALQTAPQPGTTMWTIPKTPPAMKQGPLEAAVTNDGTSSIILLASWTSGLWRYVEP